MEHENTHIMQEDFLSQQHNIEGTAPLIDLKKGDKVEFKDNKVFFTREINLSGTTYIPESIYMNIIGKFDTPEFQKRLKEVLIPEQEQSQCS
jgi:hypothetical protein